MQSSLTKSFWNRLRSLISKQRSLCEYGGPAALMGPSFVLEHFEHRHLTRGQRIACDLLQPHGYYPAFAGEFDLRRGQAGRLIHAAYVA